MHWSGIFAAAICAGTAVAHSGPPIPILGGNRKLASRLAAEKRWQATSSQPRNPEPLQENDVSGDLEKRQNTDNRCGPTRGSCAEGYCCSSAGWCGKTQEYCQSPDCQLDYGSGCDGNQKPSGAETADIPRPKVGEVPYGGEGIYDCWNDGDIAVTFDDGPYEYTDALLDLLAKYKVKATFFMTGTNLHKGKLNDPDLPWASIIQRMAAEGHQIASHTWSHENFSAITDTQARNQMLWNEIAFNDILGYIPTYMRPPYSICERNCQTLMSELGYHIVYFNLDTEGYLHTEPGQIQTSKDLWDAAVEGKDPCRTGYLQIEHDIHEQVVHNLTEYILSSLVRNGYRGVTVGECLEDPPENWYRAGSGTVPDYDFPLPEPSGSCDPDDPDDPDGPMPISTDGSCGDGTTCQGSEFGDCCSQYGWCGSSVDYCGEGCQPEFGSGCD